MNTLLPIDGEHERLCWDSKDKMPAVADVVTVY